jgi:hypothetical protein
MVEGVFLTEPFDPDHHIGTAHGPSIIVSRAAASSGSKKKQLSKFTSPKPDRAAFVHK